MASVKKRGRDTIFYDAAKGALVSAGALTAATWYKIASIGTTASAFPAGFKEGQVFKSPESIVDAITLETGDSVWPLTLTEICKGDIEISGESGVIEATDSCDYPYDSNILDGYTNLSGSINTMLRFDEETDELVSVTQNFLNKFFDIVEDDGEGTYTFNSKDDSDLIGMVLMNRDSSGVVNKIENWWIIPMILSGVTANAPLKEIQNADYSWSKGQGPASVYLRKTPLVS